MELIEATEILAKYYQGIDGARVVSETPKTQNKAIAIIGPPKSGKSWFAASIAEAVGVTNVLDFDNRQESLDALIAKKHLPLVVKTYVDEIQSQPHAWNDMERDIARFKYNKESGLLVPAANVIDSLTFCNDITANQFFVTMQAPNIKLFREVKLPGTNNSVRIPEGWDIINATRNYLYHLFAQLRTLGHLVVVFHERPIVDKTLSTPTRPVYTGKVGITPPYLNELLSVFNDVWRISYSTAGGYQVTVRSTDDFDGACTFNNAGIVEPANIADLMKKG